jgi:hypothetical protein
VDVGVDTHRIDSALARKRHKKAKKKMHTAVHDAAAHIRASAEKGEKGKRRSKKQSPDTVRAAPRETEKFRRNNAADHKGHLQDVTLVQALKVSAKKQEKDISKAVAKVSSAGRRAKVRVRWLSKAKQYEKKALETTWHKQANAKTKKAKKAKPHQGVNSRQVAPTPDVEPPAWDHMQTLGQLTFRPASCFRIQSCSNITGLAASKRAALARNNFAKCINVFGALVIGKADCMCENNMLLGANILAQSLDPNGDGKLDNPSMVREGGLQQFGTEKAGGSFLVVGRDFHGELIGGTEATLGSGIASGAWFHDSDVGIKQTMSEEVLHLFQQYCLAGAYPAAFGSNWGSRVCQATKAAQCDWYQNDKNSGCTSLQGKQCTRGPAAPACPKGSACAAFHTPGQCYPDPKGLDCSAPQCDCVEFFAKVYLAFTGSTTRNGTFFRRMIEGGLTATRAGVEAKLKGSRAGNAFLKVLNDPKIVLPRKPFSYAYTACQNPHAGVEGPVVIPAGPVRPPNGTMAGHVDKCAACHDGCKGPNGDIPCHSMCDSKVCGKPKATEAKCDSCHKTCKTKECHWECDKRLCGSEYLKVKQPQL